VQWVVPVAVVAGCLGTGWGQDAPAAAPPPQGTVIFEKKLPPVVDTPETPDAADGAAKAEQGAPEGVAASLEPVDAKVEVGDEEREAIAVSSYDLEVHLSPADAGIAVHAAMTVKNESKAPLTRVVMQLSSSLVWESVGLKSAGGVKRLAFVQHRINTDTDHTGAAREVVVTLPEPLAAGAQAELVAFYSGKIERSAERLERIGAPAEQAAAADWDAVSDDAVSGTALRGYGNVLWYPVASEAVFLGDGAKLFDAVGRTKQREQKATVRLRLTVEYAGEAPNAAYFCGRRQALTAVSENKDLPVAQTTGTATAEFKAERLGFRVPSLFVTERAATMTDGGLVDAVTDQVGVLGQYAAGAAKAQPMLMDWLGSDPLEELSMIDHAGQPFEDGALLVAPMQGGEPAALAPVLAHTLAHAWFRSNEVWLDEGVAQLMSLLWVERNDGRDAALARLQGAANSLALAEPEMKADAADAAKGQSLIEARSEVYYRTKAAAVLWMLRSIAGEEELKKALKIYRRDAAADATDDGFEKVLETASKKDLRWFFDDWVYRDRGLPDLSIAHVAPRQLPDKLGRPGGWLVAVGVRNDGDAVAEVPVTVRAGGLTSTETLRIPGHSDAATRILFEGTPDEVAVNDGSVPELRTSVHTAKVVLRTN